MLANLEQMLRDDLDLLFQDHGEEMIFHVVKQEYVPEAMSILETIESHNVTGILRKETLAPSPQNLGTHPIQLVEITLSKDQLPLDTNLIGNRLESGGNLYEIVAVESRLVSVVVKCQYAGVASA